MYLYTCTCTCILYVCSLLSRARLLNTLETQQNYPFLEVSLFQSVHISRFDCVIVYYREAMPGTQVVDIRFAYNVKQLMEKWKKMYVYTQQLETEHYYLD